MVDGFPEIVIRKRYIPPRQVESCCSQICWFVGRDDPTAAVFAACVRRLSARTARLPRASNPFGQRQL